MVIVVLIRRLVFFVVVRLRLVFFFGAFSFFFLGVVSFFNFGVVSFFNFGVVFLFFVVVTHLRQFRNFIEVVWFMRGLMGGQRL